MTARRLTTILPVGPITVEAVERPAGVALTRYGYTGTGRDPAVWASAMIDTDEGEPAARRVAVVLMGRALLLRTAGQLRRTPALPPGAP